MIEEKLLKIDDLARNIDRIALDVDSLKLRSIPPKHDINESLKDMRISIDECKERTTTTKKDTFVTFWAERIFFCHTYDTSMTIIVTKPGIIINVVGSYFYDK